MNNYRGFEADPLKFGDLKNFTDFLHANHMKYVPIIHAVVAQREDGSYKAYANGKKDDVFIKVENGEFFTGSMWPLDAVYPDFFK